ncbi:hypothetical protein BSKO_11319 [Bryopsis sp. KO-2023]|nr:hypothetical protein BSKO_11319 [Bryopsis sp. KO-2023]
MAAAGKDARCPSTTSEDSSDSEFDHVAGTKSDPSEQSIVSEICQELVAKGDHLTREIDEMRSIEGNCVKVLETLQREQAAWTEKLDTIKNRLSKIQKKKDEATVMLDLHRMLLSSGGLAEAVRAAQEIVSEESSENFEVKIQKPDEQQESKDAGTCPQCHGRITAEDMLSSLRKEKCENYTSQPCRFLTLCEQCAVEHEAQAGNSKSAV